jgi:hypothetical protein
MISIKIKKIAMQSMTLQSMTLQSMTLQSMTLQHHLHFPSEAFQRGDGPQTQPPPQLDRPSYL